MFFVHDVTGVQHAYRERVTPVGRRPAAVTPAAAHRPLGPGESAPPPLPSRSGVSPSRSKRGFVSPPSRQPLREVREIFSKPALSVLDTLPLLAAMQRLDTAGVRHLPVTSAEGLVVGLLSQRDVLTAQARGPIEPAQRVRDAMTQQVLTSSPSALIRDAARTMLQARVGSLPVVNDQGELVGIVTRSDILSALVAPEPLQAWG